MKLTSAQLASFRRWDLGARVRGRTRHMVYMDVAGFDSDKQCSASLPCTSSGRNGTRAEWRCLLTALHEGKHVVSSDCNVDLANIILDPLQGWASNHWVKKRQ